MRIAHYVLTVIMAMLFGVNVGVAVYMAQTGQSAALNAGTAAFIGALTYATTRWMTD